MSLKQQKLLKIGCKFDSELLNQKSSERDKFSYKSHNIQRITREMIPDSPRCKKFLPWVLMGTLCDVGDHFIYPHNKCSQQFIKHKINSEKVQSNVVEYTGPWWLYLIRR
jgi:hypothetical protein